MKRFLIALAALIALPLTTLADAGDKAVIELYNCTLKDGKTAEEVIAHNRKWLALVRKTDAGINSYALQPIVGETGVFQFADSYPSLAAWAAAKQSLKSDEGGAIEQGFGELLDCDQNRLLESTES